MYQERRHTGGRGLVIIAVLAFICVAMWWLESRFNATIAIIIVGSLVGAGLVIVGFVLNMASTKYTLNSASEFNRSTAEIERYRQLTAREVAKGDAAWHKANAQLTVMEAKNANRLARQNAGLLVDPQHPQPAPDAWQWDDAGDGDNWNVLQ